MKTELPNFLTRNPYGEIRLTGHRIGLLHIVECHNQGLTPDAILGEYPTLSRELIEKTVAFYLDHRADVDAYVAETRAEIERQANALPNGPTALELRRRMENRQRATMS